MVDEHSEPLIHLFRSRNRLEGKLGPKARVARVVNHATMSTTLHWRASLLRLMLSYRRTPKGSPLMHDFLTTVGLRISRRVGRRGWLCKGGEGSTRDLLRLVTRQATFGSVTHSLAFPTLHWVSALRTSVIKSQAIEASTSYLSFKFIATELFHPRWLRRSRSYVLSALPLVPSNQLPWIDGSCSLATHTPLTSCWDVVLLSLANLVKDSVSGGKRFSKPARSKRLAKEGLTGPDWVKELGRSQLHR
jgi:hypothetical protein